MKPVYIVTEISENAVTVVPLQVEAGAKNGITVLNPRGYQLEKNCKVYIGFSKTADVLRGIAALLVPMLCAAAGLYLSRPLAMLLHRPLTELFKMICAVFSFLSACSAVFILSRSANPILQPEITALA